MKNEIKEKLENLLNKDVFTEDEVNSAITKIRKLLEVDNHAFEVLKFYCDWALHAKINNTKAIKDKLNDFRGGLELIHIFTDFDKELKGLLAKFKIETNLFNNRQLLNSFHHHLSEIYSNTPLIVGDTRVTLTKIESFGNNSGIFSMNFEENK